MGARGQLLGLLGLLACCCALLRGDVINKYMKYNPKASESTIEEYEFDWIAYLDMNPDVVGPKMDQDFAWQHYYEFGKKEGRHYPRRFPEDRSLANAEKKMIAFVGSLDRRRVSVSERTLLLYYLPTVPDATSHDALMNTFKIFLQAVDKDTLSSNFYWFNVLQGDESPFSRYIPRNRTNVVQLHWEGAIEQNLLQLRTLDLLHGSGMHTAFGSVYFGDVYTRGPLALEANGQWIAAYRSLLNKHNTGLVGASFSCELVPHVQNHSWAIHQNTVPLMLNAFTLSNGYRKWKGINALKEEYFSGRCLTPQGVEASKNPIYWSNLPLSQLVFVPWDYHTYIHQSASMKSAMIAYLYEFHSRSPSAQLFIPETVYGGYMHDLTLQYNYEMYMEAIAAKFAHNHPKNIDADGTGRLGQQVCLLVRSSYIHSKDRNISLLDEDFFSGFDNLAKSLLRQTDGNWIAYYFITDHFPFSTKLKKILAEFGDSRLQFLHIPRQFRQQYTAADAGYTATDIAFRKILANKNCQSISFTNADNIYGTDVVRRIRNTIAAPDAPKMILTPLDSRNFIYQDLMGRSPGGVGIHTVCTALLTVLQVNTLGMAVQPRPILGKIDLAGVFFDREQLVKEGIFFSNFTNSLKFPCTGCQDGYFTEYLVQNRHWRYAQLPVDGLQSLVFHGPSPIWCLASGLVWFGHPHVSKARCFTPAVVNRLKVSDMKDHGLHNLHYDWAFYEEQKRVCLQYTMKGYAAYQQK